MTPRDARVTAAPPASPVSPRGRRLGLAVSLACSAALALGAGAYASPGDPDPTIPSQQQVDEAKAKLALASRNAEDITAALDAADARLTDLAKKAGTAAEQANAAALQLQAKEAQAKAAEEAAAKASAEAALARGNVDGLAAQVWMSGGSLDGLEVLLTADGADNVGARAAGLDLLATYRGSVFADAAKASDKAAEARRVAAAAKLQQEVAARRARESAEQAQSEVAAASAARAEVQGRQQALLAELASVRKTSVEVEAQRREGLAQQAARERAAREQAAREAAEREAAARASRPRPAPAPAPAPAPRPAPAPDPSPAPPPAPNRGGAAAAIAYARAQLGKPYIWGGEGPVGYDCSGLTKMAWAQAGVSLYHYTGSQWSQTRHVPLSQAQPGDLIFYGSSGEASHHVGLYLGGGQMIHAPTFGEPVKISSIYWGDLLSYAGRVG